MIIVSYVYSYSLHKMKLTVKQYFYCAKFCKTLVFVLEENLLGKSSLPTSLHVFISTHVCRYVATLMHYTFLKQRKLLAKLAKIYTSWKYPILQYVLQLKLLKYWCIIIYCMVIYLTCIYVYVCLNWLLTEKYKMFI